MASPTPEVLSQVLSNLTPEVATTQSALGLVLEQTLAPMIGRTWRAMADERRAGRSKFPYVKLGKQIFYRLDAIKQYLLALEVKPQTPAARAAQPRRAPKPMPAEVKKLIRKAERQFGRKAAKR